MNLGLSVLLSFRQSGSFLKISSVVFAETQYGLKITCKVSLDRQSFFLKNLFWVKMKKEGKIKGAVAPCKKYVFGKILFHRLKARMFLLNQNAEFFNHQNISKESINILKFLHGSNHQGKVLSEASNFDPTWSGMI